MKRYLNFISPLDKECVTSVASRSSASQKQKFTESPSTATDPHKNKLKTSSGEAVLKTTTPPLNYLPSLDEIKQKANDPELKKLPKAKEKLPNAKRCRPGDKTCQSYWQKKGKPSSNIGQIAPREDDNNRKSFANLLAWNSFPSPLNAVTSVSDVPFGLGAFAAKAAPAMFQGGPTFGSWPTEMTQGRNRTGSTDLFSGNYNWSLPIVGLPGRAGHDLGLSLSYNSHVWVKTAGGMQIPDVIEDLGTPGGGFRLGLPFLHGITHTTRNGFTAYLLVLPSGKAIELIRRGGSSSSQWYESRDGSVLRLVVETSANQYLFFPDGTRLRFQNFQCTEMRDRNGNVITATYDPMYGLLTKLTDTLGREITFHYYDDQSPAKDFFEPGYDGYFEITDIKQSRKDENGNTVTVTLAHFGYSDITINTNFVTSSGVPNGTVIPMLTSALLADGTLHKFDYTSYGQVKKISRYAPQVANPSTNSLCAPNITGGCDYRLISYTTYNLPSTNDPGNNTVQTDCPRFTSRFDWAFEWNAGVTTTIDKASDLSWAQVTTADGTNEGSITREFYNLATNNYESWQDGLPYKVEAYASGQTPGVNTPKKTTLTTWQNDATWGPRVANTTVMDGENSSSRYTDIQYWQNHNLPTDVYEFKGTSGNGTMLRYTNTSYVSTQSYIKTNALGPAQRWIIGLPSTSYVYQPTTAAGGTYTTLSKVTYQYDQSGYLEHQLPGAGSIINHDTANFGLSFLAGRGNLTSSTRWDATDENNAAKAITSSTKYNTTGSPTTQYLPDNNLTGRTTIISYLDSFSDTATNNTLAYPTTVTDPDSKQSKVQYRFDIGAVTRTQDPKMLAADASKGIVSQYNALGRLTRVDNQFSTGYTRHLYDTALYWRLSYSKADDVGNELYAMTIYDGHGRTRANFTAHPNSALGNRSQYQVYDAMGRVYLSSNPTEVSNSWNYVGGDDNGGYIWSQQTYDWKGRPKVTTNPDNSYKTYDYGGCGCTGEATVTVTDEVGRKTRSISDAFLDHTMQVSKTEVLNMDGTTVYSTTATVNKPLERKSYVLQVAGATTDYSACANGNCNSATRQQTTKTFDGLGRLQQQQAPQQSGATPYTAYEYYPDGSLKKSTDARGAYALLNYNARGLTTSINYSVPGGVETTPNVSFSYDANGNRETMTDGAGSVTYLYDTLSRMLSETRTFTGLSGSFPLSYEYYGSTGQMKKVINPFGASVSYDYDLAGRTRNITGSAFAGVTSYATNINYRAWGGTKSLTSDNNVTSATMGYDALMRVNNFQMSGVNASYAYYADGKLNTVTNPNNHLLDRSFNYYDPKGTMTHSGAYGVSNANQFYQNVGYDVFGNFSGRGGRYWWMQTNTTFTSINNYVNNKLTSGIESGQAISATHDVDGNVLTTTQGSTQTAGPNKYDAASRLTSTRTDGVQTRFFDGDGNVIKDERIYFDGQGGSFVNNQFLLISSVLGGKPYSIVDYNNAKLEMSVYGSGQILARQKVDIGTPGVTFFHRDPHNTIDFTGEIKWIDPMGTTGKAADAAYIAQYQNGNYNYGSGNIVYSGFAYMGNYTNQNPAQSTVCKDGLTTVNCGSLFQGIRNGQFSNIWFRTTGLAGYDENTTQMAASFGLAASMKNGQLTGGGARITGWRKVVVPGESAVKMSVVGDDTLNGEVSNEPGSKAITGYDAIWSDGGSGLQLPVQLPTPPNSPTLILMLPNVPLPPRPCTFNINLNIGIPAPGADQIMSVIWDIFREAGHFVTFNSPEAASGTKRGDYTALVYEAEGLSSRVQSQMGGNLGYTPAIPYPIQNGPLAGLMIPLPTNRGYVSITRHKQLFSPSDVLEEIGKTVAHEDGHYALSRFGHYANDTGLMGDGAAGRYFSAEQARKLSSLCN
jgi:hypothetical protein